MEPTGSEAYIVAPGASVVMLDLTWACPLLTYAEYMTELCPFQPMHVNIPALTINWSILLDLNHAKFN